MTEIDAVDKVMTIAIRIRREAYMQGQHGSSFFHDFESMFQELDELVRAIYNDDHKRAGRGGSDDSWGSPR